MKHSEQLNSLLSRYFSRKLGPDDLRKELKKQTEEGREFMIREAQLKSIDTISLSSSEADSKKCHRGILAVEAPKEAGNCTTIELNLNSIESLRQHYKGICRRH